MGDGIWEKCLESDRVKGTGREEGTYGNAASGHIDRLLHTPRIEL